MNNHFQATFVVPLNCYAARSRSRCATKSLGGNRQTKTIQAFGAQDLSFSFPFDHCYDKSPYLSLTVVRKSTLTGK